MSSDDYKETEMGLIPKEWEFISIKNSPVEIIDGDRSSNYPKRDELLNEGDLPFLSTKNIKNNRFNFNDAVFVTKEKFDSINKGKLNENDIVMTTRGSVGNVALFKNLPFKSALINAQMLIFRSNSKYLSSQYLYYLLTSNFLQKQFNTFSSGSAQPQLPISHLKSINLIIPSLKEQNSIAKILTDLDKKIELNHEMNRTLEAMGQAIFRHWFVHFEFPDKEGRSYKSSGGEMVDSELGEIPKGWKIGKLKDVGKIICGKTPPKSKQEYFGGEVPFIKIPDMHGQTFVVKTEDSLTQEGKKFQQNKTLPANSVCISCIATVGLVCITPQDSQTNQQINSIIPQYEFFTPYLYYKMSSIKDFIEILASGGSATLNLNTKNFSNIDIIIPSDEVLKKYYRIVKLLFDHILNNQIQNENLSQLRDSLLPKLMSGKIRVNIPEEATVK